MAIRITRVNRDLDLVNYYEYISDEIVNLILDISKDAQLKCLKYLDKIDHTFFNSKQWPQLKKEIDILRNNQDIPDEIIMALYDCLEDVKNFPDQYFSFIGD